MAQDTRTPGASRASQVDMIVTGRELPGLIRTLRDATAGEFRHRDYPLRSESTRVTRELLAEAEMQPQARYKVEFQQYQRSGTLYVAITPVGSAETVMTRPGARQGWLAYFERETPTGMSKPPEGPVGPTSQPIQP